MTGENPFDRKVPWFSLWPAGRPREVTSAAKSIRKPIGSLALAWCAREVPEYCFTDAFSSFCFASLYIRPG